MDDQTKAEIRAAGGIIHADGNIFFTNVEQFKKAAAALSQPAAQVDSSHSAGGGVQVRTVLLDVEAERQRQDIKWGGPNHDDSHEIADFVQLIEDYAGWARTRAGMGSYDKARNRLIQVAALASACCESIDRAAQKATP